MWSVARTAAQIQETMNTEIGQAAEGLVFEYYMGEGEGSSLTDGAGQYTVSIPAAVTWFIRIHASVLNNKTELVRAYPNPVVNTIQVVITSYSIHYTKLYE